MAIRQCFARRWGAALAAAVFVLATAISGWASGSDAPTPDAFDQNKRLGRGVNILGYDPIWQDRRKARFQEKYFRLVKEAGFSNMRINLHPFRDGKLGPDHKLGAAWLATLDWAMKHALANRLMVILDLHEYEAMGDDPAGNREPFLAVWRQLAEHCKDAPRAKCSSRSSTSPTAS